jgi:hypothetical protein
MDAKQADSFIGSSFIWACGADHVAGHARNCIAIGGPFQAASSALGLTSDQARHAVHRLASFPSWEGRGRLGMGSKGGTGAGEEKGRLRVGNFARGAVGMSR